MRVVLALCLALVSSQASASLVSKSYHFQYANLGNFDVVSESGIDYSGLFTSGIEYDAEYDDAGTFLTRYDRSTPPNFVDTISVQQDVPVLSDAVITHNALSLIDSSGFTPWDGSIGYTYSFFQLAEDGGHALIKNALTNYVNFEKSSSGVERVTLAFYWVKDGIQYSDTITGLGVSTLDMVPEASSIFVWSLVVMGCCCATGRRLRCLLG